ncbi:hypothetical protein J4E90_005625 [Alternaria incomplexa]|uniref:uncharacterized protein n=1 Tax=Alternaria incomplexa TaxID=1187928 RepID=UPI0022205BF6|nr:uncharacterized protein J4E90_005625 [Alternaria incomplexa]KAI4913905.1 hypothetical protein J4E90_005625 [Alternaria incomplexa]
MATFTQPTRPIDFRRDIEAFNLYHSKCTTKPIRETVAQPLYALENTEPIVDRTRTVYTKFRNAMVDWKTRIDRKHDADANRWYFHRMKIEFRAVEHELYGATSNLASASEGDTDDATSKEENHDDESTDDDESEVGQELDASDVAQSERPTDSRAKISTRTDEASAIAVAEKAPGKPFTKTQMKPSARTTHSTQRRKSEDIEVLGEREIQNMHYSERRGKGIEFRGGTVDPEKAHLEIGKRELAGHDDDVVLIERESNVRGAA